MTGATAELVGREAELALLDAFLADRAVLPAAAVIEGPAGAGKTTVWSAAVRRAESTGYLVLACRPLGAEVQLSLAALSDLLEPAVGAVLPALPAPQREALEVALLLRDNAGRPPDQRAISAGVLNALRGLSQERPVLIAIDDAQWLDAQSAEIIEFALRRLAGAPVAVLASVRTEAERPGSSPRGLRLAAALGKPSTEVTIGPLSLGAMNRLLRSRTSLEFSRRTLQRIHETSRGNPFYALELGRAMVAGRTSDAGGVGEPIAGEPLALTAGLNELLAGRLAGLGDATRTALFVAAAAAEPTVSLVRRVLQTPAEDVLRPAVETAIIHIDGDTIEFAHPLLAAAAYQARDPGVRRHWHARLAAVAADVEARARHLALARQRPDREVATLLRDAGDHARLRGALHAAATLSLTAIDWLPTDAAIERATWAIDAGPVLLAAGGIARSRLLLEGAVAALPAGPVRSDALLLLAEASDDAGERILPLIDQALVEAGPDKRRRIQALLLREVAERAHERLDLALDCAREALGLAEQVGDDLLLADAQGCTAFLEVVNGLAGDPVAHFRKAIELDALVHVKAGNSAPAWLAICLVRAGRVDEARPILLGLRSRALAEGDETSQSQLSVFLAELEWLAGRWADAATFAEEGAELERQWGRGPGGPATMLALVEASRGDPARARGLALTAGQAGDQGDLAYGHYARQVLAFLDLSLGNAAAAHEAADTYAVARGIEGPKRLSFVGDEIEALVALGQLDRATELTEILRSRGEALHRPPLVAIAARSRALGLGARGELDGAIRAGSEAVDAFASLGLPFELARSLLVLGEVQRRAKQRRAARDTLTSAIEIFERLGAARWAERAAAERARVGGRSTIEGLTETELRVARLVAAGRSNKEVAAELFVSVRAVESNLSKVYAKLGIRSRTELARRI